MTMRDDVSVVDLPKETIHHELSVKAILARSFNDLALPCELVVASAEPPSGGAG